MLTASEKLEIKRRTAKPMLWLGIVSICMLFAGFTSAYVVSRSKSDWVVFDLPRMFYVSTAIILVSSGTMAWALSSAKKNDHKNLTTALLATLVLGLCFAIFQYFAWGELWSHNIYMMGSHSHPSGSYLYVITLIHVLHLMGGLVSLGLSLVRALKKKYNSENLLGLQLCSIYWHFLDGLWIYLFFFLLIFR